MENIPIIRLGDVAGGALQEIAQEAIADVVANMQDVNTPWKTMRMVTIKLKLTRCATLYRTIEKAKKRIKSLPNFAGLYLEYQLFDFSNITCFPKDAVECHAQIMTQNLVLQTGT